MKDEWLHIKNLLDLANSQKYPTNQVCEGIVVKTDSVKPFERISFKVISNHYLLKYNL